jgi:RNA polymerase sigma factor (sigma-70 family)
MANAPLAGVLRHIHHLAAARGAAGLSDAQLLDRFVATQDEAAFTALVQRHSGLIMGMCRRVLQHAQDAEDAFQAAFLVLAKKAASIRNKQSVSTWLYAVAYHIAVATKARAARRRSHERQAHPMSQPDPLAEAAWHDLQPVLDEELHRLPEKYRRPLVLCYLEGKTNREAADELGWPVGSMSRRLARARELLRANLARRGVTLSGGLLALVLTQKASPAVTPVFVRSTATAALRFAAGRVPAGAASATAVHLAQSVLKAMILTKFKIATALVLAVSVITWVAFAPLAGAQKPAAEQASSTPEGSRRNQQPADKDVRADTAEQAVVTGRVLNPDGKPAVGADVAMVVNLKATLRHGERYYPQQILARTKTDGEGKFRLSGARPAPFRLFGKYAWAIGKGARLTTQELDPGAARQEITLKLFPERFVSGRLVDLQGQPVAGLKVHTTHEPRPPFRPGPVSTDARGRFTLRADFDNVAVLIRDDRFALHDFYIKADNESLPAGKEPTLVLAPPKFFEGRVTYADTGKPAAGARIVIGAQTNQGIINAAGRADAQGRYKVNPYLGNPFWIQVYPADGEPYLTLNKIHGWPQGAARQVLDFALPRGVLVRGKITEQASGQPVAGAAVLYRPRSDNPNQKPDVLTGYGGVALSGPDGTFRTVVYPGPGHLLLSSSTPEYIHTEAEENQLTRGKPGGKRLYPDALVKLDPPVKARVQEVAVQFRRGAAVSGRLVGPDGKPVKEAVMVSPLHGFTAKMPEWRAFPEKVYGGRFTLFGCEPEKTYKVHFLDDKNKLGASAEISARRAEGKPVTVALRPCGSAVARFVDGEGKPLAALTPYLMIMARPGAAPSLNAGDRPEVIADEDFVGNLDRVNYASPERRTDAQGQCTFSALIPGATYRVTLYKDGGVRVFKEFTAEAGKTLTLPDAVVK